MNEQKYIITNCSAEDIRLIFQRNYNAIAEAGFCQTKTFEECWDKNFNRIKCHPKTTISLMTGPIIKVQNDENRETE